MKRSKFFLMKAIVFLLLPTTILTGCGLTDAFNPRFKEKLNINKVVPIKKFDGTIADSTVFSKVSVLNANGNHEVLATDKKPILFVAYWCPHCQRTLLQLSRHLLGNEMPTIVSMGFVPGTSLGFAKKVTAEELSQLKIPEAELTVTYLLSPSGNKYVKEGYPTLAFVHNGKLMTVVGEHTWSVWSFILQHPTGHTSGLEGTP